MKTRNFAAVLIVAAPLSLLLADDVPKPFAFARYQAMMDRSPFAVATAVAAPAATPNFAKDLFIANAAHSKDGDFVIDPSGTLPDGKSFKGPAELRTILMEKKGQFAKCLTEKLMTYALGRGVQFYDRRAVNKIVAALEKDDYKFSRLVIEIAQSDPFRMRRGTEQQVAQDKLDKQQDKPK